MVMISRFISAGSLIWSSQWTVPILTGILGVSTLFGLVTVREMVFFAAGAVFWSGFNRRRSAE